MAHEEDERVCFQSKSVRQQCVPGRERLSDEQLPPILSGRTDMISMMNHEVFPVASEGIVHRIGGSPLTLNLDAAFEKRPNGASRKNSVKGICSGRRWYRIIDGTKRGGVPW